MGDQTRLTPRQRAVHEERAKVRLRAARALLSRVADELHAEAESSSTAAKELRMVEDMLRPLEAMDLTPGPEGAGP